MTSPVDRRLPPSLWSDGLGAAGSVRPPLTGDLDVDVAIVGAGFTGLWTAWHLRQADPGLRIVVIDETGREVHREQIYPGAT